MQANQLVKINGNAIDQIDYKNQEKKIYTTVDIETYDEIKQSCQNCNMSIAEFLRLLIQNQKSVFYKQEKQDNQYIDL